MTFGKTMIKALKTFDINNPKGGGANNYTSTVWIWHLVNSFSLL